MYRIVVYGRGLIGLLIRILLMVLAAIAWPVLLLLALTIGRKHHEDQLKGG